MSMVPSAVPVLIVTGAGAAVAAAAFFHAGYPAAKTLTWVYPSLTAFLAA